MRSSIARSATRGTDARDSRRFGPGFDEDSGAAGLRRSAFRLLQGGRRGGLALEYPRDGYAQQIEHHHRHRHQDLAHDVGRRQDRADHERRDDRITGAREELARRHDARKREEEDEDRELEDHAEGEDHLGREPEDLVQRPGRHDPVVVPAVQELEHDGEDEGVAEERARDEEDRRGDHERKDRALLAVVETGGDEGPQLPEADRERPHESREQRALDVRDEDLRRRDRLKLAPLGGQRIGRGREQEGEDLFGEAVGEDRADHDRCESDPDSAAELCQVLRDRKRPFIHVAFPPDRHP